MIPSTNILKLYLAVASAGAVLWFVGIPAGTVVPMVFVALMVIMHLGGHGGHGGHGGGQGRDGVGPGAPCDHSGQGRSGDGGRRLQTPPS